MGARGHRAARLVVTARAGTVVLLTALVAALVAVAADAAAGAAKAAPTVTTRQDGDPAMPVTAPPVPEPRYGIEPPVPDGPQERVVDAADGTSLHTQTWLPAARDGDQPPARLPVVVVYTPYATPGIPDAPELIDLLVPRGYAVTFASVRGTGASGGCFTLAGPDEVGDGARIIEDAGRLAPWASGRVGMYGASYPGGTQLATATGPDRERLASLGALVVGAPSASLYDVLHHDGVAHFLSGPGNVLVYLAALSSPTADLSHIADRPGCVLDQLEGTAVPSGDYTSFYEARDHVRRLDRLRAATLMFHGTADRRVPAIMQDGLFDRIPEGVPRAGVFGVWGHELPPLDAWPGLVLAWFDHHLRGIDGGVGQWPVAQVQATDGRWRAATDWPAAPGARRPMLLGPGGTLDATAPTGSTTYLEAPVPELEAPPLPGAVAPAAAVFESPPLDAPVTAIGTTWLDLWVRLTVPDAHVTARIEVVDDAGHRVVASARTVGARSAQHLEPLDQGRFRQATGLPAPVGEPLLVAIRFDPTDLAVPVGARLRLTIAGSAIAYDGLDGVAPGLGAVFQGPTWPSGVVAPVTILHDADHPSALRLTVADAVPGDEPGTRPGAQPVPGAGAPGKAAAPVLPRTGGGWLPALPALLLAGAVAAGAAARAATPRSCGRWGVPPPSRGDE